MGEDGGILGQFDIGLLPLGLAYGKRGVAMPLVDELLDDALDSDRPLAHRLVRGLAAVGFYYPESVFATLAPRAAALLSQPDGSEALVATLATIRVLHFDRVDLFLGRIGAPDSLRARVAAHGEPGLIARCIDWIGWYNNAVHQALHYPAMRRTLLIGALRALGEAKRPADFIGPYTDAIIDMGERAQFRLIRWTSPDFDAASPGGTEASAISGGPAGAGR